MTNWMFHVKIKHLYTDNEDLESVQASMNAIADVLKDEACFTAFRDLKKFRTIPKGDEIFGPVDYANLLLSKMYDYADANQIWIC